MQHSAICTVWEIRELNGHLHTWKIIQLNARCSLVFCNHFESRRVTCFPWCLIWRWWLESTNGELKSDKLHLIQDVAIARRAMIEICLFCEITILDWHSRHTAALSRWILVFPIGPKSWVSCLKRKKRLDVTWSSLFLLLESLIWHPMIRAIPQRRSDASQGTLLSERNFPKAAGKDLGFSQT